MARFRMKYKYFFGCMQITFKVWSNGNVDVKLDDNFALSVGYGSAFALRKRNKVFQMATNTEWARVQDGKVLLFSNDGFMHLGSYTIYGDLDLHY